TCNALYKCFADIERIGDHAINILQYSTVDQFKFKTYEPIKEELQTLLNLLSESFTLMFTYQLNSADDCYNKIECIEDKIDELTATYRDAQIKRLVDKKVEARDCVNYSEIMTDIERVSDHMMNIIQECKRCSFTLREEDINALLEAYVAA
ncbi:MAG: PhoU domain-containing protein, partial [Longicatena sp.]